MSSKPKLSSSATMRDRDPEILPSLQRPAPSASGGSSPTRGGASLETTLFITVALILHAVYITMRTDTVPPSHNNNPALTSRLPGGLGMSSSSLANSSLPELFIYRRTRKTGSSSMVNALLKVLPPLGYVPLKHGESEVDIIVRNEFVKPASLQRRLFVVHHNQVRKDSHPRPARAVIADTVRDGFETITSYCRQKQRVASCAAADILPCLKSDEAQAQVEYRFGGSVNESDLSYIDLPLSSRHPALSTTVMRSVFTSIDTALQVDLYNVHESACRRDNAEPEVRQIYDELYFQLDEQTVKLQRRMLGIAGYPFVSAAESGRKADRAAERASVSLDDMLDAADELEKVKYPDLGDPQKVKGKPEEIIDLLKTEQVWERSSNGELKLATKRRHL